MESTKILGTQADYGNIAQKLLLPDKIPKQLLLNNPARKSFTRNPAVRAN